MENDTSYLSLLHHSPVDLQRLVGKYGANPVHASRTVHVKDSLVICSAPAISVERVSELSREETDLHSIVRGHRWSLHILSCEVCYIRLFVR